MHPARFGPSILVAATAALAGPAAAHEAWLLTPAEIEALAAAPIPVIFRDPLVLGAAAAAGALATALALRLEDRFGAAEERLAASIARHAAAIGPLVLRLGLAAMLALAATGGLPRHGTAPWAEPTLLVPDMQLALVPGWDWLASAQIALAAVLVIGAGTRAAGLALVGLSALGLALFDTPFLAYAPHFAAPGLMLALLGGGALSVDRALGLRDPLAPAPALAAPLWRAAQVAVGAGFVYLAVAYKLTQPTLLIAILEHGQFPTLGLPMPVIALAMTGVEILCGALLVLGRLTRPVALMLAAAITLLAVTLGETPLFHANLYGTVILLAMAGRWLPAAPDDQARLQSVAS